MLPIEKAYCLLDYLCELWNSHLNYSFKKNVHISFYGGEPLLNMEFITNVVHYVKKMKSPFRTFSFSMTTNAMLLDRNIDFLVEHDFMTLISLDGDEENNGYRIDKNGKSVFERVIGNVDSVKEKYPDYFERLVSFNSVLHNKNSVDSIYSFFKERYNKTPSISELSNSGIRKERKKEFEEKYRNSNESLEQAEHYSEIIKDMSIQLGTYKTLNSFLNGNSNFVYNTYNELLWGKSNKDPVVPTGTCLPFSKKIFLTVNGKILPCERIGHHFALGTVENGKIELNYASIANKYNAYYSKMNMRCKSCFRRRFCVQCIYNLSDINQPKPICHGYMTKQDFEVHRDAQIHFLAQNPEEYFKIMEETIMI
jgi:uncharacterized protein